MMNESVKTHGMLAYVVDVGQSNWYFVALFNRLGWGMVRG
jgi:hypothetical protein